MAVGFCLGIAINEWIKARKADKRAELHSSSDFNPAGQLKLLVKGKKISFASSTSQISEASYKFGLDLSTFKKHV